MVGLFASALFLSAALLFLVQPMFARMVLPLLGGSPSVWNTAMVFYQIVLLAGYLYAHLVTRRLGQRQQLVCHGLLLLAPIAFLPIAAPAAWQAPTDSNPTWWLLAVFAVAVGAPFFVVATSGPLLQHWFSRTGHHAARDPYFLAVASNAGSFVALLAYPLIEPLTRLRDQSLIWSLGYGLLVVALAACGVALWRANATPELIDVAPENPPATVATAARGRRPRQRATAEARQAAPAARPTTVTNLQRGRWVALAFVPSSLMLAVTQHLSTQIAPIPLLWVIPLAIYLLTFIVTFAQPPMVSDAAATRFLPIAMLPVVASLALQVAEPILLIVAVHLFAFAAGAVVCHGRLAAERPHPTRLTEFYLWLSAGGALGGVFNSLIAPSVFNGDLEYPIALTLLALVATPLQVDRSKHGTIVDVAAPTALGVALPALAVVGLQLGWLDNAWVIAAVTLVPLAIVGWFGVSQRPIRFALGVAALLIAGAWLGASLVRTLHQERTFFGVHRVLRDPSNQFNSLAHGNVIHGSQALDPRFSTRPTTYYSPSGPAGQVFDGYRGQKSRVVGVVGLGAGSLACYREPDQPWTFFEIDPAVARIARAPNLFTYLSQCAPEASIKLGDARLMLQAEPAARYDTLVLDAYTSDALPVHLLTREAVALYLDKLAPGGHLLFNISNKYADLEPVIGAVANDLNLVCLVQHDTRPTPEDVAQGKSPASWALVARSRADLGVVSSNPLWRPCLSAPSRSVWTDERLSVIETLRLWR